MLQFPCSSKESVFYQNRKDITPLSKRKTVLITGSSQGIGRASALALSGPDKNIVINYHTHREEAEKTALLCRKKGAETLVLGCDIGDFKSCKKLHEIIQSKFLGVDILVNNAGISVFGQIQDMTPEQWRQVFRVNVDGVFYNTKLSIPHMIEQKWGRIINISSIWGLVGGSCESLYSASKGAVLAFTKACAKELGPSQITCNAIAPGNVETGMLGLLDPETRKGLAEETPIERLLKPEEIALWIVHLADENAGAMTGQVISPNGGWVIY